MSRALRVGVALPHSGYSFPGEPLGWERVAEVAAFCEEQGFDAIWASDHFVFDQPPLVEGTASQLDPLVVLPALATLTNRIRLGTLTLAVGFRPPSVVAKAAASLDRLSGGRLTLGLGAGWMASEYARAGIPFPPAGERLEQLEEAVQLIRAMLAAEVASFQGKHFRVVEAPNRPGPVQDQVPIWVGAHGERALRVVARVADGWNIAWRITPDEYPAQLDRLHRACREVGRDPDSIRRSVALLALVGEDESDLDRRYRRWQQLAPDLVGGLDRASFARTALVGTPGQVRARLERFRQAGVDEVILAFAPVPFAWFPDGGADLVAADVLADLR